MCCGLRATCCGLLILLVAKLQVAKMSCCELLNCRLRWLPVARFIRFIIYGLQVTKQVKTIPSLLRN